MVPHDAAALCVARHGGQAIERIYENSVVVTFIRAVAYGRVAPRRTAFQMALAERVPRIATLWSMATECLFEGDDLFRRGSAMGRRARACIDELGAELERAAELWPIRSVRLDRLVRSLPNPPKLTHAATRHAQRDARADLQSLS